MNPVMSRLPSFASPAAVAGPALAVFALFALLALVGASPSRASPASPVPKAAAQVAPAASSHELGAVFYTPAQRLAIALARRPAPAPGAAGEIQADVVLRFDGLVRSSGGMARAFVNGREITPEAGATPPLRLDGHLVRLPEGTRLAVGQSVVPGMVPGAATSLPEDLVPAGSVGRAAPPVQPVPLEALQLRRSQPAPTR